MRHCQWFKNPECTWAQDSLPTPYSKLDFWDKLQECFYFTTIHHIAVPHYSNLNLTILKRFQKVSLNGEGKKKKETSDQLS